MINNDILKEYININHLRKVDSLKIVSYHIDLITYKIDVYVSHTMNFNRQTSNYILNYKNILEYIRKKKLNKICKLIKI